MTPNPSQTVGDRQKFRNNRLSGTAGPDLSDKLQIGRHIARPGGNPNMPLAFRMPEKIGAAFRTTKYLYKMSTGHQISSNFYGEKPILLSYQ